MIRLLKIQKCPLLTCPSQVSKAQWLVVYHLIIFILSNMTKLLRIRLNLEMCLLWMPVEKNLPWLQKKDHKNLKNGKWLKKWRKKCLCRWHKTLLTSKTIKSNFRRILIVINKALLQVLEVIALQQIKKKKQNKFKVKMLSQASRHLPKTKR